MKGRAERKGREGRCIFDLGVGGRWNWMELKGIWKIEGEEGGGGCCSGLDGCVSIGEGEDVQVFMGLACLAFHPSRGMRPRIDYSAGGIVVGYAFV